MVVAHVSGPGQWLGAEMRDSDAWKVPLTAEHRREVLDAVQASDAIAPGAFPLPTLGPVLRRVRDELADGRGFVLVQGVPVEQLSERQCEIAALGLGSHVGEIATQGPGSAPLTHVRDTGADASRPKTRSYQHSGRLRRHLLRLWLTGVLTPPERR
ncbi:hypothetical protein ACGFNP_01435 [Nonomuraea sp. NPDC049269]|uniref:hypothetical protein n=1 Tax=Nonomuraea sp. NPDC049269 TaxID=3364349 RepID=UPI0037104F86